MTCQYCLDTGIIDNKTGLPVESAETEGLGPLTGCPLCKKDKVKELVFQALDKEINALSRKDRSWYLELSPAQWDEALTKEFEKYICQSLISKNGFKPAEYTGKNTQGWFVIKFHPSLWYRSINYFIEQLPNKSYKLEINSEEK